MSDLPIEPIALRLGMERHGNRWDPCPVKGCREKGRGAVQIRSAWKCWHCQSAGDAYDLVSYRLLGVRAREAGPRFREVKAFVEEGLGAVPEPVKYEPMVRRVAGVALRDALRACEPAQHTTNPAVRGWLAKRGLVGVGAGVLPPRWTAPWWPWSDTFPLVVGAYTGRGELASMHGRCVQASPVRKTTWPKEADAAGLLFADRAGRELLRGAGRCSVVVVTEGMPDFLAAAGQAEPGWATLGITSGAADALRLVRWPAGVEVFMAVHRDEAGYQYARAVADAVAPIPVRRLPIHRMVA